MFFVLSAVGISNISTSCILKVLSIFSSVLDLVTKSWLLKKLFVVYNVWHTYVVRNIPRIFSVENGVYPSDVYGIMKPLSMKSKTCSYDM